MLRIWPTNDKGLGRIGGWLICVGAIDLMDALHRQSFVAIRVGIMVLTGPLALLLLSATLFASFGTEAYATDIAGGNPDKCGAGDLPGAFGFLATRAGCCDELIEVGPSNSLTTVKLIVFKAV